MPRQRVLTSPPHSIEALFIIRQQPSFYWERKMQRIAVVIAAALILAACASGGHAGGSQWPQRADEQRACADMGIDPGTALFDSCVGDLDATMMQVNLPGGG
jgi:hypothetical protein